MHYSILIRYVLSFNLLKGFHLQKKKKKERKKNKILNYRGSDNKKKKKKKPKLGPIIIQTFLSKLE